MAEKRTRQTPKVPFVDATASAAQAAPVSAAEALSELADPVPAAPLETAIIEVPAPVFVASADSVATSVVDAEPEPAVTPAVMAAAAAIPEVVSPAPATIDPANMPSDKLAAPRAANPFLKGFPTMATAPEMTYASADKFQAMFGDVNERAKSAVEKTSKLAEELTELTKGNVEAIVASGRVAAKGAEAMTQEVAEYSKKSFESATGALKSFAAVKSPTELFQLQSEFAKSSFDSMVAEASKVSESMLKLMGEIAQPLSTRYAVAAEKLKATTTF